MRQVKEKVLTTKKLQAILDNPNRHLIGVEFKTNLDVTLGASTQMHPTLEQVRVEEGALMARMILNPVLPDPDGYQETLLSQLKSIMGLSSAERMDNLGGGGMLPLDPSITTTLDVGAFIGSSSWVKEYTVLGVHITEVYIPVTELNCEYYVRLLFSSEDNLRPLSSFINKKLDTRVLTWLLDNLETGIFGSYVELIDVEHASTGSLFMVPVNPTNYGLGFRTLYTETEEGPQLSGIATGGLSTPGQPPVMHSVVSLQGYTATLFESNGVYNVSLEKTVRGKTDRVSIFVR